MIEDKVFREMDATQTPSSAGTLSAIPSVNRTAGLSPNPGSDRALASDPVIMLPMKRARSSSCERDLELLTRRRRRQLRIEIPKVTLCSQCPAKSSSTVKESPSSLFSAASTDSIFDDIPPSPALTRPELGCTATSSIWPLNAAPTRCAPDIKEFDELHSRPALLTAPPIQGLYFDPSLCLPQGLADKVVDYCMDTYFRSPNINQVMLFGSSNDLNSDNITRFSDDNIIDGSNCTISHDNSPCSNTQTLASPVLLTSAENCTTNNTTGLPTILLTLLLTLSSRLKSLLPTETYTLLFPSSTTQARQAIINLYTPGEGISPHVDLLKRYGDGIIGVSFGSGCVMRFDRETCSRQLSTAPLETLEKQPNRWDLYLPERSVLVLTEEARYGWTHGIDTCTRDYVAVADTKEQGRWIDRGVRLSVTYRWLLPGAHIVGPSDDA